MKMEETAIMSEKGQITIPKPLRDQLGLRAGTTLVFHAEHGTLRAKKQSVSTPFQRWRGKGRRVKGLTTDQYLAATRGSVKP